MARLIIITVIFGLLSCTAAEVPPVNKPVVTVTMQLSAALLPFIAISHNEQGQIDWRLNLLSAVQIEQQLAQGTLQTNAVELDILSLLRLKRGGSNIRALWALYSNYGLVINNLAANNELAIEQNEISSVLADLWAGSSDYLLRNVHNDAVRANLLREGRVRAVVVGEPYLSRLANEGFVLARSGFNDNLLLNTLVFLGDGDDELFTKMLSDYRTGMLLYLDNPEFYNSLLYQLSGQQLILPTFDERFFYDVGLFLQLAYLINLRQPFLTIPSYIDLFWLPNSED
ncbi:MAG: hypothetical protein FWE37_08415 [Spirochaetaceae bacterium]|nr:hypothetical protein [Spirochaetaceae bacterium]